MMAPSPHNSGEVGDDLNQIAQFAGSAIRSRLQQDMNPIQQDKAHVSFEPEDHADLLRRVIEKFTEEFPSRHPNSRLLWGKGVIILRRTTFEEGALGQVAEGRWMLALATSGEKSPGNSFSLREKLHLETGDIYLRYSVKEVS